MVFARHLLAQSKLAYLLVVAALLLKLLVPTGWMVASDHGRVTIILCPGSAPRAAGTMMTGMHGDMAEHGKSKDHGKPELPCAFSGLFSASLGAIDPIQLAALIAFVMTVGFAGLAMPPLGRQPYLRPPLRGPPARL